MPVGPYGPDEDPLLQRLAAALFVSLLIHTSFFAVLQIGNQLNWWDAKPFAMFRKARLTPEELAKVQERLRQQEAQRQREEPRILIQITDPEDEPPPESARFYSTQSSRASNPEPGNQNQPKIDGRQTQVPRLEDAPKVATGRSTPPPPLETPTSTQTSPDPVREAAAPPPVPVPEPVAPATAPQLVQQLPEPRRAAGVGDLAKVNLEELLPQRPAQEPPPQTPPAERTPAPAPPTPPNTPSVTPSATPTPATPAPRARPRTVVEAKLRQNLLAGEKMQQDGGVPRMGKAKVDAQGTGFAAYDLALVEAVQNRWYTLLDERRFTGGVTGSVVVKFRLYSDGSVRIVEPTESTVDALLESLCIRAVRDPAPYEKWPSDMLRMIGSPSREVKFTFYYN